MSINKHARTHARADRARRLGSKYPLYISSDFLPLGPTAQGSTTDIVISLSVWTCEGPLKNQTHLLYSNGFVLHCVTHTYLYSLMLFLLPLCLYRTSFMLKKSPKYGGVLTTVIPGSCFFLYLFAFLQLQNLFCFLMTCVSCFLGT